MLCTAVLAGCSLCFLYYVNYLILSWVGKSSDRFDDVLRKLLSLLCKFMEGEENHESPRFCIEASVHRGGWKLAVLWLHHGATLQSAIEATVYQNCKTVCFNQLYGDMSIFRISKRTYFFMFH